MNFAIAYRLTKSTAKERVIFFNEKELQKYYLSILNAQKA
jgi:hypothetical protein